MRRRTLAAMLAFIHMETGDDDEALRLVEDLAADDFVRVIGRPVQCESKPLSQHWRGRDSD